MYTPTHLRPGNDQSALYDKLNAALNLGNHTNTYSRVRLSNKVYDFFVQKSLEGNYGDMPRFVSRFMNDLSLYEFTSDPTILHLRVLPEHIEGRIHKMLLASDALDNLDYVALSAGLPRGDPSIVFNNIYTGYLTPIGGYPNTHEALELLGIELPSVEPTRASQPRPNKTNIIMPKPVKIGCGLSLTQLAMDAYGQPHTVDSLYLDRDHITFTDTRSESFDWINQSDRWTAKLLTGPLFIRAMPEALDYLAEVAVSFGTNAVRRNTPAALTAVVLNSLAEGWLSIA